MAGSPRSRRAPPPARGPADSPGQAHRLGRLGPADQLAAVGNARLDEVGHGRRAVAVRALHEGDHTWLDLVRQGGDLEVAIGGLERQAGKQSRADSGSDDPLQDLVVVFLTLRS